MPSAAQVPVEALLRLSLDKAGAQTIQDFLDKNEQSWSRVEQVVGRIGTGVEGIARTAMGLAGIAGIGAIANNFIQTSQAGSNLALAAGHVTGGVGTWHPYGQSMLAAQAQTGVQATQIAQGLIMAVQEVGGNPSPQQAAVLGGLIAGYGQTVGLTPAQVAQVVAPLLQASNKPLTAANLLGLGATLSGGLTAFPGSQAAPMLGLLSQLGVAQALGGGPGFTPNMGGLTAVVNSAAQANSIFRSPSITGGAINAISGGLQNAFGNPSQEAFFQMAGISYSEQREGFTPQNMQRIMSTATRIYGSGPTRDIFLRSMFGLQGADLLETFAPGSHGAALLNQALKHPGGSAGALQHAINNAQQRTTPQAGLNRAAGGILGWLESSPLHALLGLGGIIGGPKLLSKGLSTLGGRASSLLGGGSSAAEDAAGGSFLEDLLGSGVLKYGGVAGALASSLIFPDSISSQSYGFGTVEQTGVRGALTAGLRKFGQGGIHSAAARKYMQGLIYNDPLTYGSASGQVYGNLRKYDVGAGQLLDRVLGNQYAPGTANDPVTKLGQAADQLLKAAQLITHSKFSSYTGGASNQFVGLGTPGVQALGAMAPGMEFASLTSSTGFSGGAATGTFVSLTSSAGGGGGGGGGGAPCTLTWYDPGLGGINSSGGVANPHGTMANGQPYNASAFTCAAPPAYAFGTQIQFSYNGQSITCTVTDRGGAITGSHFDLSRGAFTKLVGGTGAGKVSATFKVISTGGRKHSSSTAASGIGGASIGNFGGGGGGGGGGGSSSPGTGSPAGSVVADMAGVGRAQIHVHVHVDGRKQRAQRVLLGHKRV